MKLISVIPPCHSHLSEHESVDGGEEGSSVSGGLGGPVFLFVVRVGVFVLVGLFLLLLLLCRLNISDQCLVGRAGESIATVGRTFVIDRDLWFGVGLGVIPPCPSEGKRREFPVAVILAQLKVIALQVSGGEVPEPVVGDARVHPCG